LLPHIRTLQICNYKFILVFFRLVLFILEISPAVILKPWTLAKIVPSIHGKFHGISWNSIEFHGIPLNFMKLRLTEFDGIQFRQGSITGLGIIAIKIPLPYKNSLDS
jgi:hypothetical protein